MGAIRDALVPINKEGYPFVAIFAVVTLILFAISTSLGWIGLIATAWCLYFFRDPDRFAPEGETKVISPADGVVCLIDEAAPPAELEMGDDELPRVCIFMNVFDVHVNRVPAAGTIDRIEYRPGKFLSADLDKASEDNERNAYRMTLPDGNQLAFVQIAGLVARRIVWHVVEGQEMVAGERFGLIRFGSRVDVYLPKGTPIDVRLGQTMIAGETILADLANGAVAAGAPKLTVVDSADDGAADVEADSDA